MATSPTPPSSSLPQPLSYEQILGQMLSSYAAGVNTNDLNTGSANTSFMQLVALMVARSSGDIFQILMNYSLQRATGPALQNLAIENGVPPLPAVTATSQVTVVDLSFQKISTFIYAGVNPPIAGSTTIYVSNAASFPATGSVYIGRGSVNIEGPLPYASITPIGSYYAINLSVPTTKFHNISETVILSQGGVRTVPVNTIVISPGIGTTADIQYSVTQQGIILDGETTVTNVPIVALLPGSSANVPAAAISEFSGNPPGLPNASVTNPSAVTTGQDLETDNQLRVRVQNALASTGLGTVTAIESALQGVQSPDSADTIVSTNVLNSATNTTVYIDNGTGYEATHEGVAIESIVNSALGGEKYFQLVTGGTQTSVTKALLQTVAAEPFDLNGGEVLAVTVGNITYEHTFSPTDFANPGSATAYEVCASINKDTVLNYEAVTAGDGTYVVIRPEDEVTNTIHVTTPPTTSVIDANTILQFPSEKAETLRLFKNGILLTEDGTTASIFTASQSLWSATIAQGDTLSLSVDGTAPITYTLTNANFVAEGTYPTVSYSNSLQSWVNVFNDILTGVTASIVGSTIELTSNLGAVDRAQITVVNTVSNPSSLIGKGMISNTDLTSTGVFSDYILDRNTAQIQLASALVKNDVLSAGTLITQANIKAGFVASGAVTLTSDAYAWIAIDTDALLIPTVEGGSEISVSKVAPNIVRYTANSLYAFSNVIPGDYVIVWSLELPATDRLEGRVHAATGATLDIKVTAAEWAAATPVSDAAFIQGFVVVRTENVPQKFLVSSSISPVTLYNAIAQLQTQTDQLTFGVFDSTNITAVTNTLATTGQIFVVTANSFGALLGFTGGVTSKSQVALTAYYETQATQAELPLFFQSTFSADSYANPPYTFVTSLTSSLPVSSFDPNELITFLNPYGIAPASSGTLTLVSGVGDATITFTSYATSATPYQYLFTVSTANASMDAIYSNNGQFFKVVSTIVAGTTLTTIGAGLIDDEQPSRETVQMSATAGDLITILPVYPDVRRIRVADRFYIANPLDFGYNDTVVAIVDNNTVGETYTLPLFRAATTNSSFAVNNFSFNAYDTAAGATTSFAQNFAVPADFFANYKALLQAKVVVSETPANTSLLYRSTLFGRSGEVINVAYIYPTAANQPISSTVTVTNVVSIRINLASGTPITSNIAANTQWNVTVTPNTPVAGVDQVTYTWNGIGTNPALTVVPGNYVTILPSTGFLINNTGTFLISSNIPPTATSFTVQVPTGTATAQSNVLTTILNGIYFYNASPTTATAISTYVNANLSQYVTTTVVNGTGAGVIAQSSYENSNFATQSYSLMDGINWIASSNVSGSPQFTFKEPLAYPSAPGYAFNAGDEVILIPTTMDQVKDFWNILAVTGFTTVGTVETAERGTKLQLATNTLGSVGAIQIVGGNGNEYSVPVLTSGNLVGMNEMVVSVNAIASEAMMSDQWFRLQAQNYQTKDTGIATNTSVTVLSNTPIAGESTVTLLNQTAGQMYFGSPRAGISVEGLTFRIEAQGSLTCLSWNGVGTSPNFSVVEEGDSVILEAPFSPLNQGTYRVIRQFNNSIWYENANVIEEEVICAANIISTGYDATTTFNVTVSGGIETVSWAGAGTPPSLQNALPGDVVTFGAGFSGGNTGAFTVTGSGPTQNQIVQLTMPSGSTFSNAGPGDYFEIYNGNNANQYYVWYNVLGGTNTDPAPFGFTGIEVTINSSDSSSTVATETNTALAAMANTTTSVAANVITVTSTVSGPSNSPVDVTMPVAFSFVITQSGQYTYLTVANPSAVPQSGISAVMFTDNRPQITFYPYEATIPGDKLTVNGTVLGAGNAGVYKILQVLSPNTVVISGVISQQYDNNLAGNYISLSVTEGVAYTGYKQVAFVAMQPGSTTFNNVVFNTSAQYEKIDLSANIAIVSLGKLNFPVLVKTGIDAYNYDTGLIGVANRTIYGDPRDAITFPGVNAAGTDIFIREPLLLPVQIALSIRTNIGVSFAQITSQIQSSVYSLILSNPLGQSIDCSSIVETVREIPGVTSVVLTSPTYTVAQDEIQLVTGQKAFVINQQSDITVTLIGS